MGTEPDNLLPRRPDVGRHGVISRLLQPFSRRAQGVSCSEAEFVEVMLPHADGLLRTALRFSKGEIGAAEDAVQETFLRAWRAIGQFQRGTNARAWLFRILMNLLHKRWEKTTRQPEFVSLDQHLQTHEVAAPLATAEDSEVFVALEVLPAEQRAVLLLNVVEGFTCEEIAGMLEVPIGTVMSRLCRARAAMRNLLQSVGSVGRSL